jgi:hypothetical protein
MRRLSSAELSFLTMLKSAGDDFVFGRDDKVTAEGHRMLRRLDRAGWISVTDTDDGPRVSLTAMGRDAVNG